MENNMPDRTMILLSIVGRGKGKKLMNVLDKNEIRIHMQTMGFGTAPSEMMDLMGLTSNNKDIILSLGSNANVNALMHSFAESFTSYSEYGGLLMILKLSSANRLIAEILSRNVIENAPEGEVNIMSNAHKHNLIMITVGQGYVDEVMQEAKKVGATGGTVIKGRLAETERLKELANIDIEEEREILLIMAPENISDKIMEAVNSKFGLRSPARGIMCSIPVEKAYKI